MNVLWIEGELTLLVF